MSLSIARMIPEFTAAIALVGQAIKTAGNVVATTSDLKTKEAIASLQNGILDLQAKVFAAQAKYQELADAKREAEEKLRESEKWESEAARYQLTDLAQGISVYALKPDQMRGESMHFICPHCFQRKQKSILQRPSTDRSNYVCHECKFDANPADASSEMVFSVFSNHPNRDFTGLI
jgi:hypothetical protein